MFPLSPETRNLERSPGVTARHTTNLEPEGMLEIPTLIYRTRAFPLKLLRRVKVVAGLRIELSASEVMSLECIRYTCPQ
jgi:hypothetical protein